MEQYIAIGEFAINELLNNHSSSCIKIICKNSKEKEKYINKFNNVEINPRLISKIIKKEDIYSIAYFKPYINKLDNKTHILINNLNDEGEIGTIIRTMIAFSFFNLVLINSSIDIFSKKIIRASTGALFMCNIVKFDNKEDYLKNYKNSDYIEFTNKNAPLSLEVGAKLYKIKQHQYDDR